MTATLATPVKPVPQPRVCPTCRGLYVGAWSECGPCIADFIAADTSFDRTHPDR